jgi:hypothetical protein
MSEFWVGFLVGGVASGAVVWYRGWLVARVKAAEATAAAATKTHVETVIAAVRAKL